MRSVFALITLALCFSAAAQNSTLPAIVWYDGKTNIFPASWLDKQTKARATAADDATINSDTASVITAMGKYPSWLLAKELKHIYIVGKLSFNGQYFTGTNATEDLYIGNYRNGEIEKTFHHEFSSILLRNHGDISFEMKWRAISPALRQGNSASAVKAGLYGTGFDSSLCEKGYLSPYSLSNWENDFNMYAENIFAGGAAFWKITDRYPAVKEKMKLVVKFYQSLWGGFSEFYFRAAAE